MNSTKCWLAAVITQTLSHSLCHSLVLCQSLHRTLSTTPPVCTCSSGAPTVPRGIVQLSCWNCVREWVNECCVCLYVVCCLEHFIGSVVFLLLFELIACGCCRRRMFWSGIGFVYYYCSRWRRKPTVKKIHLAATGRMKEMKLCILVDVYKACM